MIINEDSKKIQESILVKDKINIVIYGAYNPISDSKHLGEKERLIKLRDRLREDGYTNTILVEEIPDPIGSIISNLEKSLYSLEWADLNILIFTCRGKTGSVGRELIHAIGDPMILSKCRIFEEIDKGTLAMETLLKEELTSRRYEVTYFNREDDDDLYEHVSSDVFQFVRNNWEWILVEIQRRANTACKQSKGATTEELVCKISQEVQKWQISDQEQMTQNVNNLIFTLKAKISSYPRNKEIYENIEKIGKEKDLLKQYQLIAILIALMPQKTVIGGIMTNEYVGGDKIVANHSSIVSKSSFSNAINTIKESGNYEIAKAIKDLASLIENANFENRKETIENVESLAEEAAKQNSRKGTMRVLGESILNSVQMVSEIVEKVSPLIKIISKLWL